MELSNHNNQLNYKIPKELKKAMKQKIKSIFFNTLAHFKGRDWVEDNYAWEWAISHEQLLRLVAEETREMYAHIDDEWEARTLLEDRNFELELELYYYDGVRIDAYVESIIFEDLDAAYEEEYPKWKDEAESANWIRLTEIEQRLQWRRSKQTLLRLTRPSRCGIGLRAT